MRDNQQVIIFGAGIVGRSVFYYYPPEQVYCFADNFKAGQKYLGKDVISFDELARIHTDYKVIIAVSFLRENEIIQQCKEKNIRSIKYYEEWTPGCFASKPEVAQLKNTCNGKRCFIIGNGPSLRPEDLDVLHKNNELCFASNYIAKIYPHTKWRPNYYVLTDTIILSEDFELIQKAEAELVFLPELNQRYYGDFDKAARIIKNVENAGTPVIVVVVVVAGNIEPSFFSPDPSKMIYSSWTVTYSSLQFAAYMGFGEIYLLGCDNTPGNILNINQCINEKNHFYDEDDNTINTIVKHQHFAESQETMRKSTAKLYGYADDYSRTNGFRIYNATRGGMLEAFERVDFDQLFLGGKNKCEK